MRHIAALCINLDDLMQNQGYRSHEACKKYPGAGFLPYLTQYLEEAGFEVMSGKDAIPQTIIPRTYVIQEEENTYGDHLRILNDADPIVIFCLESPLYAPRFYDRLDSLRSRYAYQFLFGDLGTHRVYFPSFDLAELEKPVKPWEERKKKVCAVMSNKHFSMLGTQYADSPTWQKALEKELHTARLQFMQTAREQGWDLYGRGYPPESGIKPVEDKLTLLQEYQFCFCYENCDLPGYITEKPVECIVAGTIPIYPNALFPGIPSIAALERIKPESLPTYAHYVMECRKSLWMKKFSYQHFAKQIAECLVERRQKISA